jgi:hypothetical protein
MNNIDEHIQKDQSEIEAARAAGDMAKVRHLEEELKGLKQNIQAMEVKQAVAAKWTPTAPAEPTLSHRHRRDALTTDEAVGIHTEMTSHRPTSQQS